jgi:hypothetical protein
MLARRLTSVYLPVLALAVAGVMANAAQAWTPQECCNSVKTLKIDVDVDGHIFCNNIDIDLIVFVSADEILDFVDLLEAELLEDCDELASEVKGECFALLDVDVVAFIGNCCYCR